MAATPPSPPRSSPSPSHRKPLAYHLPPSIPDSPLRSHITHTLAASGSSSTSSPSSRARRPATPASPTLPAATLSTFPLYPDSPASHHSLLISSRPSTRPTSPDPLLASTISLRSLLNTRHRRPSTLTQSFLEGVDHVARVRSPSLRGHSRRPSLDSLSVSSFSVAGAELREALDDDDDDDEGALFQQGDRLAPGSILRGQTVTVLAGTTESGEETKLRLEIVRKVGSGSYAVVYLAKRILYDPVEDDDQSEEGLWSEDHPNREGVIYGEEFALKCLSKTNLSDDLLEVQKFEATLMKCLPSHPNIVALHGAFETPDWLFLVLEYCPGQDLFYWLEQARDHDAQVVDAMHPTASFGPRPRSPSPERPDSFDLAGATPRAGSILNSGRPASPESTPPNPYLLSTTSSASLLSRRRLRLISRMFIQMCEAVEACHDVGISHRDIKPENFICCDVVGEDPLDDDRRVTVKLTDWGLGSMDVECGDFDCGSKPYMAYECRNNLAPTYRPAEADVWSLGIVLLNLLYHRCPWSDPSPEDEDFATFRENPSQFLQERFEGMGKEVADFLAYRVFCDIPAPGAASPGTPSHRISARDFGKWANKLVRLLGSQPSIPATVTESPLPVSIKLGDDLEAKFALRGSPRSSVEIPPTAVPIVAEPEDDIVPPSTGVNDEATGQSEAVALAARAKRRKRGARKPKRANSTSVDGTGEGDGEGDDPLKDLADASEYLARELSRTSSSANLSPAVIDRKPSRTGLVRRFRGAIMSGNPDLEAFKQRARERDGMTGRADTLSAPAKMQRPSQSSLRADISSQNSTSSFGSVGTSSWGSWSAPAPESDAAPRGRSHWASSSNRRERLLESRLQSSSVSAATSPSRRSSSTANSEGTHLSPPSSVVSVSQAPSTARTPGRSNVAQWLHTTEVPTPESDVTPRAIKLDAIAEQRTPTMKHTLPLRPVESSPTTLPGSDSTNHNLSTFVPPQAIPPSPAPDAKPTKLTKLFRHLAGSNNAT